MTDAELKLMADAQPTGPSWKRDVILELLEHRARIAAHVAAHPERLSDRGVSDLLERARNRATGRLPAAPMVATVNERDLEAAAREILDRRAADPAPEDLAEARRLHEWCASTSAPRDMSFEIRRDLQQILEKLLAAHGARP